MHLSAITGRPIVNLIKRIHSKLNPGQEVQQKVSYPSHFFTDAKQILGTIHTSTGVIPDGQLTVEKPAENPDILKLKLQMSASTPVYFGMNVDMKKGATEYSLETGEHYMTGGTPEMPTIDMRSEEDSELLEREITGALTEGNLSALYWEVESKNS